MVKGDLLKFRVAQFMVPPETDDIQDLRPKEHLGDVVEQEIHIMDEQPTNLHQLCDVISVWTISVECSKHLVEAVPPEQPSKGKGVQTWYLKRSMSVDIHE